MNKKRGKNSFKAANLLGCKSIWQAVCLIYLFVCLSQWKLGGWGFEKLNKSRERSVHVSVGFVWLILSLWELLGRGVRMEKVMEVWRWYRREKGKWRKLIRKTKDSMSVIVKKNKKNKNPTPQKSNKEWEIILLLPKDEEVFSKPLATEEDDKQFFFIGTCIYQVR